MKPGKHQLILATSTTPLTPAGAAALGSAALMHTVASHGGAWVAADAGQDSAWLKSVPVRGEDLMAHRDGYCSQTLAPAYFGHYEATLPQDEQWQKAHHIIAGQYAHTIASLAAPGAAVWIHDYPLQLVPGLLRRLRPDLRIGFSLHSPFPPAQTLQAIAERDQITTSILAADLATFTDARSAANFAACTDSETMTPAVMPMPADAHAIAHAAATVAAHTAAGQIRARLHPATKVFLSTGGTDSGDGTIAILNAFAHLLDDRALQAGKAVLIHLAPAGEPPVGQTAALRHDIERLTAQINGKHATVGYMPVHYQRQDLNEAERAAFYLAADVMLATPVRDRATPHAAEYAATRANGRGRVVLSEFSSSQAQLPGAIIANPHEPGALEQAMLTAAAQAAAASPVMRTMCAHVLADDVTAWARQFLRTLCDGIPNPLEHGTHQAITLRRNTAARQRQEGKQHHAQPGTGQLANRHIRNSLLLATCADRLAAPLHGIRLPTPAQVDAACPAATGGQPSHLSSQLLATAGHYGEHDGTLDEDSSPGPWPSTRPQKPAAAATAPQQC